MSEETEQAVRQCAEIAMERCRLLNGDATAMDRRGRHEMARIAELKADQFLWMANRIAQVFDLEIATNQSAVRR